MSSYRKTMGEVYNGMYLVEGNIDKIKDIVSKKKATKIDGVMVDLFTASAISQVYDKAGSSTKKKMEILPITKLASVVMKMMGSITNPRKMKNDYVPEELDLDEDGHTDVASAQNNVKVATAALTKMSGELAKLSPEDALPSWWTNKVAVAVDKLDGMADYLDTQVEEVDEDYVLTVKDKEVNRYKSEKDARKAFHDLVKQHGHRNVKVFKEEADLDEASARGDAKRSMRRDRDFGRKDDLDKDDVASDDDVKAASKNIMMQLRKAANLRGTFAVEFGDKKKVKVDPKVAQAAASKYNSLRRPADKEKFQSQIAKSYKDMLKAIKEAVSPAQQAAIAISKKERGEKPKKESRFNTINKQLKGEK